MDKIKEWESEIFQINFLLSGMEVETKRLRKMRRQLKKNITLYKWRANKKAK